MNRIEETRPDALDKSTKACLVSHGIDITDFDNDGLLEIDLARAEDLLSCKSDRWPMATYFDDSSSPSGQSKHLTALPQELKVATENDDFKAARRFFKKESDKPFSNAVTIGRLLALHLSATAIHAGVGIPDDTKLENKSGFSRTRSKRLRFDCGMFVKLAYSNLKEISGYEMSQVFLSDKSQIEMGEQALSHTTRKRYYSSRSATYEPEEIDFKFTDRDEEKVYEDSGVHALLLISTPSGKYIIVDNDRVTIYSGNSPLDLISKRYSDLPYIFCVPINTK